MHIYARTWVSAYLIAYSLSNLECAVRERCVECEYAVLLLAGQIIGRRVTANSKCCNKTIMKTLKISEKQ